MQFKHVIGIDVSKFTLDCVCHHNGAYLQVENHHKGYKQLLKWARKQCGVDCKQILFCFEHTGIYSLVLAIFLQQQQVPCIVQSALAIKRSLGLVRGKNDKADARQIARYAYLHREELPLYQLPSKNLLTLKSLLTLRDRMVQQRAGYLPGSKARLHPRLREGEAKRGIDPANSGVLRSPRARAVRSGKPAQPL